MLLPPVTLTCDSLREGCILRRTLLQLCIFLLSQSCFPHWFLLGRPQEQITYLRIFTSGLTMGNPKLSHHAKIIPHWNLSFSKRWLVLLLFLPHPGSASLTVGKEKKLKKQDKHVEPWKSNHCPSVICCDFNMIYLFLRKKARW